METPFLPLSPEKYIIGKASHTDILSIIQFHLRIVLDLIRQREIVLTGRMCNPLLHKGWSNFIELLNVCFFMLK